MLKIQKPFASLMFIASVFFLALSQSATAQTEPNATQPVQELAKTVHIPDEALRTAVLSALGKDAAHKINRHEMTQLEVLDVFNPGVRELTGLEFAINLRELQIPSNEVSDISALAGLKNLTGLFLPSNQIGDISPLAGLTNLTGLVLDNNEILDVSALKGLTNLKWLLLENNEISDVSPLAGLTNLTDLSLSKNVLSDVSALKDLKNLTGLYLDNNHVTDVSPLAGLGNLTGLHLDKNEVSDISPLAGLTNLKWLLLNNNRISALSPLADLGNLKDLYLDNNQISDISALKTLGSLTALSLRDNQVSELTPLADLGNLKGLYLSGNQISDVSPLTGLGTLTHLFLDNNQISDFSPLEGLVANLEKYNNHHQENPQGVVRATDVNRDGVVNIKDLAVIASHFPHPDIAPKLAHENIYPDVNGDGRVDVLDIVSVTGEIEAQAGAPARMQNALQTSKITVENLEQWIRLAKQLETQTLKTQKGIAVLEQLLAALTVAESAPKKTRLLPNYPNPFNPETWIPYQLAKPAAVTITLHAADGTLVRTLQLGQLPAGVYRSKTRAAYWDGRNELGEAVASGLYFYTLMTKDYTATGKMLIRK